LYTTFLLLHTSLEVLALSEIHKSICRIIYFWKFIQ